MDFDWQKGFSLNFDLNTGLSNNAKSTTRMLSQMSGMYNDNVAFENLVKESNPLVYEFYELGAPNHEGDLAAGTSICYPGKVGQEYFMTKGHFHTILDTAEIYYGLSGTGMMLIENSSGDWGAFPISSGEMVYVPKGYAHRSINVGNVPLVTFFTFRGDAGHNYGAIEEKGFRKLVVEQDGKPTIADNPKWH